MGVYIVSSPALEEFVTSVSRCLDSMRSSAQSGMLMMDVKMRRMVSRLRRGLRGSRDKFWGMTWSKGDKRPILRPGGICVDVDIWINLDLFQELPVTSVEQAQYHVILMLIS